MIRPLRLLPALAFAAAMHAAEPAPSAPPPPRVPTVIECAGASDAVSTATETTFTFRDKVSVAATNLQITCDLLVVVAERTGDPKAALGKQRGFKSLVATGNVHVIQGDREAYCGRAVVLPGEEKVVLTENPRARLLDGSWEGSGPEIQFLRAERRVVILGGTRIAAPPIRDIAPPKAGDKKASPPANAAPKVEAPK